jgi:hypothetical protein
VIDLSRRPEADFAGAIEHAMAALNALLGTLAAAIAQRSTKSAKPYPKLIDDSVAQAAPRPRWRDTTGKDASQNGRKLN